MWMIVFLFLPLLAVAYVGWHVWCVLPLGWVWKSMVIAVMVASLLLMFASVTRHIDRWPMPLAVAGYEVGTSSIMVLLYLFMLFLLLDLGRLVRMVPRSVLYQNWWTAGGIFVIMITVAAHLVINGVLSGVLCLRDFAAIGAAIQAILDRTA